MSREVLARIDEALIRLRRLWTGHETPAALARDSGGGLEMSTVLVADAIDRERGTGTEVTVADVADRLDVAHSTASRLIDRAEAAGVVTRSRSSVDQRRVTLHLTADGDLLVARSFEFRTQYLTSLVADWSDADVACFARLLDRFATDARRIPPPEGDHS